jgi:hypothetical protein
MQEVSGSIPLTSTKSLLDQGQSKAAVWKDK